MSSQDTGLPTRPKEDDTAEGTAAPSKNAGREKAEKAANDELHSLKPAEVAEICKMIFWTGS